MRLELNAIRIKVMKNANQESILRLLKWWPETKTNVNLNY